MRAGPRSGGTSARFRLQDNRRNSAKTAGFFSHFLLCAFCALCVNSSSAQTPPRPKITGIASVRLFSTDLYASRAFYSKILGFDSATSTCIGIANPCYAVNGRQRVELQQIAGGAPDNLLAEIAFSTPSAAEMREYLLAHKIAAGPITKDPSGALRFSLRDPEGNPLAFLEQSSERFFTPAAHQVSTRILHAGFIVKDLEKEKAFYEGILGFRLYWHGYFPPEEHSKSATVEDDWYEIQVPDGEEWIEFMLNISPRADKQERGVQNHFSLGVKNADNAAMHLRVNGAKKFDGPEVGRDGKNSLDIYDPDLSRVEVMDYNSTKDPCCHPYSAAHPKP
ncbi:MAG TPA: VOC family protein [Candidatus Acidoferrum sp.]|nr:VOC family protein [Candidatus Acidoferrum sp.]